MVDYCGTCNILNDCSLQFQHQQQLPLCQQLTLKFTTLSAPSLSSQLEDRTEIKNDFNLMVFLLLFHVRTCLEYPKFTHFGFGGRLIGVPLPCLDSSLYCTSYSKLAMHPFTTCVSHTCLVHVLIPIWYTGIPCALCPTPEALRRLFVPGMFF